MMNNTNDKHWLEEFDSFRMDSEFAKAKRLLKEHEGSIELADLHYFYSILYCEMERYDKAFPHAKKAYKISPKDIDKARIYAWVLSSASPKDFEKNSEALNLIDSVISEREKDDSLNNDLLYDLNAKSSILYRLGRFYEAIDNIDKTANLFPNSKLPHVIQLLYENEKTGASILDSRKPNVVDRKSFIIKLIMAIVITTVALTVATLISTYISG